MTVDEFKKQYVAIVNDHMTREVERLKQSKTFGEIFRHVSCTFCPFSKSNVLDIKTCCAESKTCLVLLEKLNELKGKKHDEKIDD